MNPDKLIGREEEFAEKYSENEEVQQLSIQLLKLQNEYSNRNILNNVFKICAFGFMFWIGRGYQLYATIPFFSILIIAIGVIEYSFGSLLDNIVETNCAINSKIWELVLEEKE